MKGAGDRDCGNYFTHSVSHRCGYRCNTHFGLIYVFGPALPANLAEFGAKKVNSYDRVRGMRLESPPIESHLKRMWLQTC